MAFYDVLKNLSHRKTLYQAGSVAELDPEEADALPPGVVKRSSSQKPAEGPRNDPGAGTAGPRAGSGPGAESGGSESKQAKGASGKD